MRILDRTKLINSVKLTTEILVRNNEIGLATYNSNLYVHVMFYCYILTNFRRENFFIDQTDDLFNRIWEHQAGIGSAFTQTYGCDRLVWYEACATRLEAFNRARDLQSLLQDQQALVRLIERGNSDWKDLSSSITMEESFAQALRFERPDKGTLLAA